MRPIPYLFLVLAGGLSLATFFTSQTLADDANAACGWVFSTPDT